MHISAIEVPCDDTKPITLGLHIERKNRLLHCNMFALQENAGAAISDNLWKVATWIAHDYLPAMHPAEINWTLTCGDRTSKINFASLQSHYPNHIPLKIDASDKHVFDAEKNSALFNGDRSYPIDRYQKEFDGQPPFNVTRRNIELVLKPAPATVFTVPCKNPAARDGVFHCVPSFYETSNADGKYEFILADLEKLIGQLQRFDPPTLDKAAKQFGSRTAEQFLASTSFTCPRDTGCWGLTCDQQGITMGSYDKEREIVGAGLITLAQKLDLPFFPIAVPSISIGRIQSMVGYMQPDSPRLGLMKPLFKESTGLMQ